MHGGKVRMDDSTPLEGGTGKNETAEELAKKAARLPVGASLLPGNRERLFQSLDLLRPGPAADEISEPFLQGSLPATEGGDEGSSITLTPAASPEASAMA